MALLVSTQSGNTNSAPYAFGVAVASGDQLQISNTAHAITFNASVSIGYSPCEQRATRPTVTATGTGGGLPAGAYRVRIVAKGSTGSANPSGPSGGITITAGQYLSVTIPALTGGATSYDVYLTQASGATGTERRYATGKAPGTFNCTSALWEDGTTAYSGAAALPFGAAFGYPTSATAHAGGVAIAAGVTVTVKGDFFILGQLTLNAGSILEFDAASSPSAAAVYHLYFGTQDSIGAGKLVMRGTSTNRAIIRSKTGTTPANLTTGAQFSTFSSMQLDLEWFKFSLLGSQTVPSVNCRCAITYDQRLTDGIFDDTCSTPDFNGQTATGGWVMTRVSFRTPYALSVTNATRRCSVLYRAVNDKTTAVRTVTACTYAETPPGVQGGGALWENSFFANGWTNVASGGGITVSSELRDCFVRQLMPSVTGGIDTLVDSFNDYDNYFYLDQVTGGGTDLNPHGLGMPGPGTGNPTRVHSGWTIEYNGANDEGDLFKSATGTGNILITKTLILPNSANRSSGTLFTVGNAVGGPRIEFTHNTCMFGTYPSISTSEPNYTPAHSMEAFKSNLCFDIPGDELNGRYMIGHNAGQGSTDTIDIFDPADVSHNAHWNARSIHGTFSGGYSCYNTRFSSAPGANDVDLGDSAGADVALFGPEFVDPTRKFITWAVSVLGASGTAAQKITTGLNALKAISDSTHADHVPGLTNRSPDLWIRTGWAPTAAVLNPAVNPGHDGSTIGAIPWANTGAPPTPGKPYAIVLRRGRNDKVLIFGA